MCINDLLRLKMDVWKFNLVPRLVDDVTLDRVRHDVVSAFGVLQKDEDMLRHHQLENVLAAFRDMKLYVRFRFRDLRPRTPSELGGRYRHLIPDIRRDYEKDLNLDEELYRRYPNVCEIVEQSWDLCGRYYKNLETEEGLYKNLVDLIKPIYNLKNPPVYPEVMNKFLRSIAFDLYFWGALEDFLYRFELLDEDHELSQSNDVKTMENSQDNSSTSSSATLTKLLAQLQTLH